MNKYRARLHPLADEKNFAYIFQHQTFNSSLGCQYIQAEYGPGNWLFCNVSMERNNTLIFCAKQEVLSFWLYAVNLFGGV